MIQDERVVINPLCCCEYIDRNNERNHLIGCCCNCIDFDQAFDRYIYAKDSIFPFNRLTPKK